MSGFRVITVQLHIFNCFAFVLIAYVGRIVHVAQFFAKVSYKFVKDGHNASTIVIFLGGL